MNTKTALVNLLLFSSFISIGQTNDGPIYAKAVEKKVSSTDLTSKEVIKKYYGINGEEVKSPINAKTIRVIKKNSKELWEVSEFYEDGFLKMEGTFTNLNEEVKQGKFKYYRSSGKIDSEGYYNNDVSEGEWRFYFPSGVLSGVEQYDKGVCVKRHYWNEDGSELYDFKQAERLLPTYDGGQEKINEFIRRNVHYPAEATKNKLAGKVVVSFWVDESGAVLNPKIEESLSPAIDNQVLKLVRTMTNWKPARQHNRPFKQMYILPVTFGYY